MLEPSVRAKTDVVSIQDTTATSTAISLKTVLTSTMTTCSKHHPKTLRECMAWVSSTKDSTSTSPGPDATIEEVGSIGELRYSVVDSVPCYIENT